MGDHLRLWVRDEMMKLVGFSEPTVVDYMIATASKVKSFASLVEKLQSDAQLPRSDATTAFCESLFNKTPRKNSISAVQKSREQLKAKMDYLEKNSKFTLLVDEPEEEPIKKKLKKKNHERKPRKKHQEESESEEETKTTQQRMNDPKSWRNYQEDDKEDNGSSDDDRDNRERDEFANRLFEKDLEKSLRVHDFNLGY